jgi:hypothetical protein
MVFRVVLLRLMLLRRMLLRRMLLRLVLGVLRLLRFRTGLARLLR